MALFYATYLTVGFHINFIYGTVTIFFVFWQFFRHFKEITEDDVKPQLITGEGKRVSFGLFASLSD